MKIKEFIDEYKSKDLIQAISQEEFDYFEECCNKVPDLYENDFTFEEWCFYLCLITVSKYAKDNRSLLETLFSH